MIEIDEQETISNNSNADYELLNKYLQEKATDEEATRIEAWVLDSDENRKEARQIAKLFFATRAFDRMEQRKASSVYPKIEQRINKDVLRVKNSKWGNLVWLSIAASLVGAVALSGVFHYATPRKFFKISDILVQTNPGVRTQVTLPDGTVVELNSGSRLSYSSDFNTTERNVSLNGEALFRVKHGLKIPFIVNSENKRSSIKVCGTTFNVQSFTKDNEFSTTLVEGDVAVMLRKNNGDVIHQNLSSGDKLAFYYLSDSLSIKKADIVTETAWTLGKLMFKRERMFNVLKRLAYHYNVEFDIADQSIYQYRFTGTFENKQLPQILEYLKISSQIDYRIHYPKTDDSTGSKRVKVQLTKLGG